MKVSINNRTVFILFILDILQNIDSFVIDISLLAKKERNYYVITNEIVIILVAKRGINHG